MKYPFTLAATQAQQIDALVDGLPVVGNGFFFTEEMLNNNEAALADINSFRIKVDELAIQLNAANQARQSAETSLATANEQIIAKDGEIAQLKADLEEAENSVEAQVATRQSDETGNGKVVPFHLRDDNPANKIADGLLGKPKAEVK